MYKGAERGCAVGSYADYLALKHAARLGRAMLTALDLRAPSRWPLLTLGSNRFSIASNLIQLASEDAWRYGVSGGSVLPGVSIL